MADLWAVVVGGGIAFASTFTATYLTYRRDLKQLKVSLLQLEEPHRQHRAGVYHNFLDIVDRLHNGLAGVVPFTTYDASVPIVQQDSASAWFSASEHRRNALRLFGASSVQDPTDRVAAVILEVLETVEFDAQGRDLIHPQKYGNELQERVIAAVDNLLRAMRTDLESAARQAAPA